MQRRPENRVTKDRMPNWIRMRHKSNEIELIDKTFVINFSLSLRSKPNTPPHHPLKMNLWFNLGSLFLLHSCLICIRCSPSKFRPTARTRPSGTRHSVRTRWCYMESSSWAAWTNHTSMRWTRIREMPITYVSVDRTTLILVNWRLRTAQAALNGLRSIRCRFVYNQFVDEL